MASVLQKKVCSLESLGASTNILCPTARGEWMDGTRGDLQSSDSKEPLLKNKTFP